MLIAIGFRTVFGAPCCMPMAHAAHAAPAEHTQHAKHAGHTEHGEHAEHIEHGSHHGTHGDDPSANPCCSACGPTLPPEPSVLAQIDAIRDVPQASRVRHLETRPPFPAYDATGPPLLI